MTLPSGPSEHRHTIVAWGITHAYELRGSTLCYRAAGSAAAWCFDISVIASFRRRAAAHRLFWVGLALVVLPIATHVVSAIPEGHVSFGPSSIPHVAILGLGSYFLWRYRGFYTAYRAQLRSGETLDILVPRRSSPPQLVDVLQRSIQAV